MPEYCEHIFDEPHPSDPTYSQPIVDIAPDAGPRDRRYALRHNREQDVFEIFDYTHPDEEVQENYTEDSVAVMSDFDIFPDADLLLRDESLEVTLTYANLLEVDGGGEPTFEYGHGTWRCPVE